MTNQEYYEELCEKARKYDDLLYEYSLLQQEKSVVVSEAIKEFANEFEYEILHKEFWNDHPHTSQAWLNGYEQCMRDMRVMLKDKLKEMVGEDR